MTGILYLTEAVTGVKLTIPVNYISHMIEWQASPEDNGFFKISSANKSGFQDTLRGVGNRFYTGKNEDATEITSSGGASIWVLQKKAEITSAIKNGISDLHMDKNVRARQAAVFSGISFETKEFHVISGFGGPEVFPHNPFSTPRPDIETIGPRLYADIIKDLTNGRLIDGSRPTDLLRTLERNDNPSQKKLES